MPGGTDADALRTMVELFGIYALLLAGWGLWQHRRHVAAGSVEPVADVAEPGVPQHERGAAARRHLNTGS
jgi:hypothetical protein